MVVVHKMERIHGLYIPVIVICQDGTQKFTCIGIVFVEVHVFLCTVKYLDVDAVTSGSPCDVCKVTLIIKVRHVKPYGLVGGKVIDTDFNIFRCHTVHGVSDLLKSTRTAGYVQQGE